MELCAPMMGFGNWNTKGSMKIDVEWQIYSPQRKTLIGTVQSFGSHEIKWHPRRHEK